MKKLLEEKNVLEEQVNFTPDVSIILMPINQTVNVMKGSESVNVLG